MNSDEHEDLKKLTDEKTEVIKKIKSKIISIWIEL